MTSSRLPLPPAPRTLLISAAQQLDCRFAEPVVLALLNHALADHLDDGGLDGLHGRVLRIDLWTTPWSLCTGLEQGRLVRQPAAAVETVLGLSPVDALRLLCRTEDPDTLFFQRRLRIDGDVELGLYVKNALDAFDYTRLPGLFAAVLSAVRARLGADH